MCTAPVSVRDFGGSIIRIVRNCRILFKLGRDLQVGLTDKQKHDLESKSLEELLPAKRQKVGPSLETKA